MIPALALVVSGWVPRETMCSLVAPPGEKIEYSETRTKKLIADAEVIVWVTGARAARTRDVEKTPASFLPNDAAPPNAVAFDVREVLKGDSAPRVIVVMGTVSEHNDYNKHSVPYPFVRPEGVTGSCFARVYKRGGQFLLLLSRSPSNQFTPYWAPLLPVNEQITGQSDPWLQWARSEIAMSRPH